MEIVHATCVRLDGKGILIRGPSGSGKSDLALRLIDRGGLLVADDLVSLVAREGRAWASLPPGRDRFAGALELHGVGILSVPCAVETAVGLIIDLCEAVERMPEPLQTVLAGIAVKTVRLNAFEASASTKVAALLRFGTANVAP